MSNSNVSKTNVTISVPAGAEAGVREFVQNQLRAWAGTKDGKIVILDPSKGFVNGNSFTEMTDVGQVKMAAASPRVGFLDDADESDETRTALGTYWLILRGLVGVAS